MIAMDLLPLAVGIGFALFNVVKRCNIHKTVTQIKPNLQLTRFPSAVIIIALVAILIIFSKNIRKNIRLVDQWKKSFVRHNYVETDLNS